MYTSKKVLTQFYLDKDSLNECFSILLYHFQNLAGLNSYKFKSRIILSDSSTLVCYKFDDLLAQLEIQNAKLLDLVTIEFGRYFVYIKIYVE